MNGKISLDTNIVIRLFKNDKAVTNLLSRNSTIYLHPEYYKKDSRSIFCHQITAKTKRASNP
ncbi:MAG: hypothetical protein Q8P28_02150 [Deltaproteobacteria bacterium]|nr:hypothetical protein [Deltaproteobacteria bacterium]